MESSFSELLTRCVKAAVNLAELGKESLPNVESFRSRKGTFLKYLEDSKLFYPCENECAACLFFFGLFVFFEAVQPPCKNGSVEQLFVFEGHSKRKSHFDFSPQ